jgi:hypothetical protein
MQTKQIQQHWHHASYQRRLMTELMYTSAPDLGLLRARGLCTLLRFAGSPPGGLGVA